MKMTFRWFGSKSDSVSLEQIRQIPGMTGVMGFLDYKPAGDVWTEEEIKKYIDEVHAAGLECEVIESVNVHEDIKLGLPTRDKYIESYRITIRNLAKYGVKCIVYNFMPVLDWLRTDLARPNPDGSTSMYYDEAELGTLSPIDIVKRTADNCNGFSLPGWEPERLSDLENRSVRSRSVVSRATFDAILFAATLPTSAATAQRSIPAPHSHSASVFPVGATSSIIYAMMTGKTSSATVPTIFNSNPPAMRAL